MESRAEKFVNVAVERGLTGPVFQLAFISGLGSVQYGYNLWLCYTETTLIRKFYNLTYHGMQRQTSDEDKLREDMLLGFSISLFPIGAMMGTLLFGVLVGKFGRKGTFTINSYCSLMFSMLMVCANTLHAFIFAMFSRFLTGISMGIFSNVVPMYLIEISPLKLRGAIGMVPHLFLVIGVQMAQIFAFPEIMGTLEGWPVLVSFSGILAIFQILLILPFPESPRYLLIEKKEEEEARQALKELRLQSNVEDELEELRQEDIFERAEKKMNSLLLLGYPELRWHVISIMVAVAGQQLSGVNVIYIYAKRLLSATHLSPENFRYIEIMTNVLLILAISFAMYVVDTKGRKVLLLFGFGVSSVLCILLTVTMGLQAHFQWLVYPNSVFVNIFLVAYAMGPSALVNLLFGELFLQSSRSSAYVIGGFSHWFLNFLTVMIFIHIEPDQLTNETLVCKPEMLAGFYSANWGLTSRYARTQPRWLENQGLSPAGVGDRWKLPFIDCKEKCAKLTYMGPYSLLFCSPISVATFFYTWKMIPETKGKTFLEIRGLVPLYRAKQNLVQEQLSE